MRCLWKDAVLIYLCCWLRFLLRGRDVCLLDRNIVELLIILRILCRYRAEIDKVSVLLGN